MGELVLILNQGVVAREDVNTILGYMRELGDLTLPEKYCKAIDGINKYHPQPQDVDEDRLWSAGYKIGYISAMADIELWWRLHQFPNLRAETAARVARCTTRDVLLAKRYNELCDEMNDLAARKILVVDFEISMTRVRQILTNLGLYNPNRKRQ